MSAVRFSEFPLSLPGARQLDEIGEGQTGAIHSCLRRGFAGHCRHGEQKYHQNDCCDQQRESGHCCIASKFLTLR